MMKNFLIISVILIITEINGQTERIMERNQIQSEPRCTMFEGGLNDILGELENVRNINNNQDDEYQLNNYKQINQCSQQFITNKMDSLKSKYLVLKNSHLTNRCMIEMRREFETESEQLLTQIENIKSQINDGLRTKVGEIQNVLSDLQEDVQQNFKQLTRHNNKNNERTRDNNNNNDNNNDNNNNDYSNNNNNYGNNNNNYGNNNNNYSNNNHNYDNNNNNYSTNNNNYGNNNYNNNNNDYIDEFNNQEVTNRDIIDCANDIESMNFINNCRQIIDINNELNYQYLIKTLINRNLTNIENILNFANYLNNIDKEIIIYKNLANEIELNSLMYNSNILLFGYRLNTIINSSNFSLLTNDIKENLLLINNQLPEIIRNFPYNQEIRLINIGYNEYMYAAVNSYAFDIDRRSIFTWINNNNNNNITLDEQFIWNIEMDKTGKFMFIKNKEFNEYLFAGNEQQLYDQERRNIFTWRNNDLNNINLYKNWMFEPVQGHDYFKIKNQYFNEYLIINENIKYDDNRRKCITWIPKGCGNENGKNCFWKIEKLN